MTLETLPPGWVETCLGEIFRNLQYGLTTSADADLAGPRFLRITDIRAGRVDWAAVPGCTLTADQVERYKLRAGDIVFARTGSIEKAARIVDPPPAVFASYLIRGRPVVDEIGPWIETFVGSFAYVQQAKQISAGIGRANLNATNLAKVRLLLPPLAEQGRLRETLDSYFSRLDAAVTSLEGARAKLKAYRASLLKAAVEGRLLPTEAELARVEKRDYESASILLKRILVERRRRWEESELTRLEAAGKLPQDERWKAKYVEPIPADVSDSQLPEGWCWATVDQLTDGGRKLGYGVLVPGPDVGGGVLLVRVGDLGDGTVRTEKLKRIDRSIADTFSKTYLKGGEVLISLVGTIGRTAVVPPTLAGANVARAIGMLPPSECVSARWIELWFRSPRVRTSLEGKAHEVARKTLNLEDVRSALVAIPPRQEQERLTVHIEDLDSIGAAALEAARNNLRRCVRLRQSMLKWAFEGKLVDQNPSDESAVSLLARIRHERATPIPVTKSLGRNSKAAQ